jgi:hypothetical protein
MLLRLKGYGGEEGGAIPLLQESAPQQNVSTSLGVQPDEVMGSL